MKRRNIILSLIQTLAITLLTIFSGSELASAPPESRTESSSGVNTFTDCVAELSPLESRSLRLTSVELPSSDYEANGVSAQAESAYTLTATILPADAGNQLLDWTLSFSNPTSAWASGKTVTDYVTLTPTSEGASTAVVRCKKSFGEQIVVTATSRDNASATATCTVDCRKKVMGFSSVVFTGTDRLNASNKALTLNNAALASGFFVMSYDTDFMVTGIIPTPIYSDYTIDDSFSYRYSIATTSQWLQTLGTAIPDIKSRLSDTLTTAPEQLYTSTRPNFVLGRYTGLNAVTGTALSSTLSSMRGNGNLTRSYLGALKTHATGYANYPILYMYVQAIGEHSNYTKYYPLKIDTTNAT